MKLRDAITPGEWTFAGRRHLSPEYMSPAGMDVYYISAPHRAERFPGEWCPLYAQKREDAEAIARLPQMLEALEDAELLIHAIRANHPDRPGPVETDIRERIRALLEYTPEVRP